jgi:hypothetical protein
MQEIRVPIQQSIGLDLKRRKDFEFEIQTKPKLDFIQASNYKMKYC